MEVAMIVGQAIFLVLALSLMLSALIARAAKE